MQRSEPTWRDAYDCEGCRDERLREDSERYAKERMCNCHHHMHSQRRPMRRHRDDNNPGIAVLFSDSSSDDDQVELEDSYLRPSRRRRHTAAEDKQQPLPQRSRHRSGGSGRKRTASRAPGLPSVTQLSISSGDYSEKVPRDFALEDIREGADGENTFRNKQNARPRRQAHRDHDEFDPQSPRPEDLRLDALRLHVVEPRGGNTNRSGRERHVSMPRNWVHANEGRSGPESPASQRLSPHVAHRDSRIRSQSRDGHGRIGGTTAHHITPPDQRNLRPPQSLPHYLGSPIQEDMTEVFPLASRRNSPSRMHRHEYEGNQPAGFTTRSKLHPNFPK